MTYCEKHEMSNCAECSGAAKRFDESMADPIGMRGTEHGGDPTQPLPIVPGASVIWAQYGGTCGGCGRRYQPNVAIFRSRIQDRGWQGYDCCA